VSGGLDRVLDGLAAFVERVRARRPATGPAGRLDALDTEISRGHRRARDETDPPDRLGATLRDTPMPAWSDYAPT
jgi:hypothetical protein